MRLALRGGNSLERLALRAGLVPAPAAEAWDGVATSGILVAAARTGLLARLAAGPAAVEEIAADLGLAQVPTHLLLDALASTRHVTRHGAAYALSRRSRRWLAPDSALSVAAFIESCTDYFDWWRDLPFHVRTGTPIAHHDRPPDDPYWDRYIRGQHDLAGLSAAYVAKKLRLPPNATSVADLGGGHGRYSAELCRRHRQLHATVVDLPGAIAVGRRLTTHDRVTFQTELPAGQDAVLIFNLLHHLTEPEIPPLLASVRKALKPAGTLAVLDAFAVPGNNPAATHLALFMHLTSGAGVHSPERLGAWLAAAGFAPPRRVKIPRVPGLALYQAGKA